MVRDEECRMKRLSEPNDENGDEVVYQIDESLLQEDRELGSGGRVILHVLQLLPGT